MQGALMGLKRGFMYRLHADLSLKQAPFVSGLDIYVASSVCKNSYVDDVTSGNARLCQTEVTSGVAGIALYFMFLSRYKSCLR